MMNRINLTESELAELVAHIQRDYDYDADAGLLVNKRRGKAVKGTKHTGTKYWRFDFWINGRKKNMNYHSAVWAWHHGRLPKGQIDHIDGDGQNNRIENLREVSGHENQLNTLHKWRPNAVTGLPGVSKLINGFNVWTFGKKFFYHDKFEAFFFMILLGRMFNF